MRKRVECQVTGRVQMVMYRDFVARNARSLRLTGTVKNMDDSSVDVVAEGEETELLTLIAKLKKGTILARVEEVHVVWEGYTGEFSNFRIVY